MPPTFCVAMVIGGCVEGGCGGGGGGGGGGEGGGDGGGVSIAGRCGGLHLCVSVISEKVFTLLDCLLALSGAIVLFFFR